MKSKKHSEKCKDVASVMAGGLGALLNDVIFDVHADVECDIISVLESEG